MTKQELSNVNNVPKEQPPKMMDKKMSAVVKVLFILTIGLMNVSLQKIPISFTEEANLFSKFAQYTAANY